MNFGCIQCTVAVSKSRGCGQDSIKGPWVYCDEQGVERRRADVGAQVTGCQAAGVVQEWGIYHKIPILTGKIMTTIMQFFGKPAGMP